MIPDRVGAILDTCSTDDPVIPPTDLFNEGWMLRLVLDWLYRNRDRDSESVLPFPTEARWYSEALLPSAFLQRYRGDKLAESWTHADGVIGQFSIGRGAKGDFTLLPEARCFVVVEAKMFSKLSAGVTNASFYDQAARNVACMAEVIGKTGLRPADIKPLGFYVAAPQTQIEDNIFSDLMAPEHIKTTVKRRVDGYAGDKDSWYESCFLSALEHIEIRTVAWEQVGSDISAADPEFGAALAEFYASCLRFNRIVSSR